MRKRWRRLAAGLGACAALSGGWLPGAARAATPPNTYNIGIDNVSQPGHNWEYIDFFPRDNINVTTGDVLHFSWNPGSPDAFHTATVLPSGQTPAQAWQANPLLAPDSDDPGNKLMLNPALGPTNPPPGSGAPGACGNAATPCTFDGSKLLNSGPTGGPSDFFVKVNAGVGTYNVVCLIHPGMQLTFNVVASGASTQAGLDQAAATQYQADTAEGNAAENAVTSSTVTNPDGTHTITAHAGTAGPHELIDEMLPAHLDVHPGDKVTWQASPNNIHTVTFPAGPGSNGVDPFSAECQSASGPDTPATGPPPDFGCPGGPPSAEQLFNPAPMGPNVIRNGGYRLGASDGGVFNFGNSRYFGSASQVHPKSPIVSLVNTDDSQGYWQAGADGGVFTFGNAPFFGSAVGKISAPIVAMVGSTSEGIYALYGSDGKIYVFGNLPPGVPSVVPPPAPHLAKPIVGAALCPACNGPGAYEVAADGGVFNIGVAPFFGSAGNIHLAKPIVGMAPTLDGGGYYLVASDGGIFTYGDATFHGSLGALHLNAPIVGMSLTDSGDGYYLYAADGGVFTFGDAHFAGSTGNLHLVSPMDSGATVPGTIASAGVISQPPLPFPSSYTFSFPEGGTFTYQCRIHDHMRASISVG